MGREPVRVLHWVVRPASRRRDGEVVEMTRRTFPRAFGICAPSQRQRPLANPGQKRRRRPARRLWPGAYGAHQCRAIFKYSQKYTNETLSSQSQLFHTIDGNSPHIPAGAPAPIVATGTRRNQDVRSCAIAQLLVFRFYLEGETKNAQPMCPPRRTMNTPMTASKPAIRI